MITVLLFFSLLTNCGDEQISTFENTFEFVKKVEIPNTVLLNNISTLDVKDNLYLITDSRQNKVYLFDSARNIIQSLEAEDKYPGLKFRPHNSIFIDNKIFVVAYPHNFIFDLSGNCLTKFPAELDYSLNVCGIDCNKIARVVFHPVKDDFVELLNLNGEIVKTSSDFSSSLVNFRSRSGEFAGIQSSLKSIFAFDPINLEILKYNKNLEFISKIGLKGGGLSKITVDTKARFDDFGDAMNSWHKIERNHHSGNGFYIIDNKLLLVKFFFYPEEKQVPLKPYFGIFNLNGNLLSSNLIKSDFNVLNYKNGYLYKRFETEMDENDELTNPEIHIYRYLK